MKPLHRLPLDDWFDDVPHPHDSMPIATDPNENPRPEEEIADAYASFKDAAEKGYDEVIEKEESLSIHEKMYRIATARYNPFSLGGSENCDSDIECVYEPGNILNCPPGGSENHIK